MLRQVEVSRNVRPWQDLPLTRASSDRPFVDAAQRVEPGDAFVHPRVPHNQPAEDDQEREPDDHAAQRGGRETPEEQCDTGQKRGEPDTREQQRRPRVGVAYGRVHLRPLGVAGPRRFGAAHAAASPAAALRA